MTLQEDIQVKFTSLELEIRKRDEIISQLQSHIQQLERKKLRRADDSGGDSTEHDASMEEDLDDDHEDHPFMRDGSVDTVLGSMRSRDRHSFSSVGSSSRRSWEEHSERETMELQELPNSIVPQKLLRKDVAIDLESNSDSKSDEEFDIHFSKSDSDEEDEEEEYDDEDDDDKITRQDGYNNWEVTLLAKQLEAKQRNGDNPNP